MVQRAEWRKLPGDPDSPLAWWRLRLRTTFTTFFGVAVAVPLFDLAWHIGFFAPAVLLASLGAAFTPCLALRAAKASVLPRLAALAPSPAPSECFPVELAISHRGICTGQDQGIASFVEGWLHVEGLRTSVSLRPVDIAKPRPLPDRDVLDIPGGQQVELRSLGQSQEDRDTFRETLRVWYRFPFGVPSGEPLLPPLAVHPSAAVRPLNTLLVHVLFLLPVAGFFVFFSQWQVTLQVMPFLIPGAAYAYRNAGKAFADLRRLKDLHLDALAEEKTNARIERSLERL